MSNDDEDNSWRLFTSEDMVQGYKALKRRKKARIVKNHADFQFTETLGEANISSVRGRKKHQLNSPSAGMIHKIDELGSSAVDMDIPNATPKSTITSVRETSTRHVNSPFTGVLDNAEMLRSIAVDMDIPSATPKSTITSLHETWRSESCNSKFQRHDRSSRTPFADITNTVQRNTSHNNNDRVKGKGKKTEMESNNGIDKGKGKSVNLEDATLKEWSRNLFEEEFSTNPSRDSVLYDENLEETRCEPQILSDDSETDLENSHEVDDGDDLFDDESDVENDTGL
uniref:Uncharacterized protein n=1 Tax=Daucus carota subsp. sativus TaxID=79200 RepID=A0A166G4H0_DAUCS